MDILKPAVAAIAAAVTLAAPAYAGPGDDSTIEYDDNDVTPVLLEFAQGIRDMGNKYGYPVNVTVRYIWEDENGVAGTTNYGNIVLDEFYAENPGEFEIMAAANYEIGFWRQNGCSAARSTALHEYGHVIDYHSPGDAEAAANAKYWGVKLYGVLPGYSLNEDGTIEPGEALANAFAAVECGTANNTERDLYNILINSQ